MIKTRLPLLEVPRRPSWTPHLQNPVARWAPTSLVALADFVTAELSARSPLLPSEQSGPDAPGMQESDLGPASWQLCTLRKWREGLDAGEMLQELQGSKIYH